MNTRRDFFAAGAAVGVLAAAPLSGMAAAPPGGALPSRAEFEALVGQHLDVAGSGSMTLFAVRPLEGQEGRLSQFVLVLGSETARTLPPAIQELYHPRTGTFALRLQPSGRDKRGHLYRAEIAVLA